MAIVKYTYDQLMNPVLQVLKLLGGSGTNEEIDNKVAELVKIPTDQLDILHNPAKGGLTEIEYRLMWTYRNRIPPNVDTNLFKEIWVR